jgi:AraC-like DNA-binding protein
MPSTSAQIPMVFVVALFSGLLRDGREAGPAERELLMKADIDPAMLDRPAGHVSAEQYARLLRLLMEHANDELLGFLSRPLRPGSLALLAGHALGSRDLSQALRRLARGFSLLQDDVVVELPSSGDRTGLALSFTAAAQARPVFLHEVLLRVFWRLLAWLAGGRLRVQRFDFAFAEPVHAESYGKLFPGLVVFDQPRSALWLDTKDLQGPVRRDEAALRSFLADAGIYIVLPRLGEDTASARVRAHLLQTQPRWPDLDACAETLHMAASTLQRRLANEGTSFRAIKDSLRRDVAMARLNGSQVPLTRLADELGFADSAAFQRAFKTWTGLAPGAVRRQRLSGRRA